jgi:hypothetical protein
MSLSSFHVSCQCARLGEQIGHEPPRRQKFVRFFLLANTPVVPLGVMIVPYSIVGVSSPERMNMNTSRFRTPSGW